MTSPVLPFIECEQIHPGLAVSDIRAAQPRRVVGLLPGGPVAAGGPTIGDSRCAAGAHYDMNGLVLYRMPTSPPASERVGKCADTFGVCDEAVVSEIGQVMEYRGAYELYRNDLDIAAETASVGA